jgi:3-hydroxyisobutyrate dehydrogenase
MTGSRLPIGFIGTGIMGASMARHLLEAGYPLHVFNRTRHKAEPLLVRGAIWQESPAAVAAASDVVFTMLGMPADVEQVYLGENGVINAARPDSLLIDMTTSRPRLAEQIGAAAAARGLNAIDAPVSGGDVGARNATLVIMVGGAEADCRRARPLLDLLGKTITRLGPAGSGQRCKLANQIAVAVGMVAWCEALAAAKAERLDPMLVHQVISGGAAGSWAMSHLAPRALAGDTTPGFLVKHLVKDIHLAREEAESAGLELPGLAVAERLYEALVAAGQGDAGTQALWQHE